MKILTLSNGTKVRIIKRNGIIEQMLDTKRVEIQFLNDGDIDKKMILYTRDLEKLLEVANES